MMTRPINRKTWTMRIKLARILGRLAAIGLCFIGSLALSAEPSFERIDEILLADAGFRHCAAKVWGLSMKGTTKGEVGLVVWRSGGMLFCGPHTSVVNGDRLTLKVPNNPIAIVDTHPYIDKPTPSPADAKAAKKVRIPNYVVHRLGVWRVASDGKTITQVAGADYSTGLGTLADVR